VLIEGARTIASYTTRLGITLHREDFACVHACRRTGGIGCWRRLGR
jgi:hypothetical protein